MNEIELYDIITLNNNERYTIVSMENKDNKVYAMLVAIDIEENPIPDKVKIIELINDCTSIKEIKDEQVLKMIGLELSKKTIEELKNEE